MNGLSRGRFNVWVRSNCGSFPGLFRIAPWECKVFQKGKGTQILPFGVLSGGGHSTMGVSQSPQINHFKLNTQSSQPRASSPNMPMNMTKSSYMPKTLPSSSTPRDPQDESLCSNPSSLLQPSASMTSTSLHVPISSLSPLPAYTHMQRVHSLHAARGLSRTHI